MADENEPVEVDFDDDPGKQATLLLAAAEDLGLDPGEVRTTGGGFLVSQELHDKAFGKKRAAKKTAATDEEKD